MSPAKQTFSAFDAGYIKATLEQVLKANDESERRLQASIEVLRSALADYPTRREFDALGRKVDEVAVLAREAQTTAEDAADKGRDAAHAAKITEAGIAPWKVFLGLLLAAVVGSAATAVGLK